MIAAVLLCETELQCKNRSQPTACWVGGASVPLYSLYISERCYGPQASSCRLNGPTRPAWCLCKVWRFLKFKIKWKNEKRLLLLFMETLSKRRKVDTECRVVQEDQSSSCLSTCVFGFSAQGIKSSSSLWTVQEREAQLTTEKINEGLVGLRKQQSLFTHSWEKQQWKLVTLLK